MTSPTRPKGRTKNSVFVLLALSTLVASADISHNADRQNERGPVSSPRIRLRASAVDRRRRRRKSGQSFEPEKVVDDDAAPEIEDETEALEQVEYEDAEDSREESDDDVEPETRLLALSRRTELEEVSEADKEYTGCCFHIGYGAQMIPCCLKILQTCTGYDDLKNRQMLGGQYGKTTGACPQDADEAAAIIKVNRETGNQLLLGRKRSERAPKLSFMDYVDPWHIILAIFIAGVAVGVGVIVKRSAANRRTSQQQQQLLE
ncbi:unnamed protein product [Amoebophrya sp. A25]|nr:unnamed protein product [Amoebophrya sp. A25]|eukprot:GSA25T00006457001.1